MSKRQKLNTLTTWFFTSGLLIARLNKIKHPLIASGCFILSALFYMAGYITWQLSINEIHSARPTIAEHLKKEFEEQYLHMPQYSYAAFLGVGACFALIGCLFFPQTFGLISAWLFFGSNACWLWAETISIQQLNKNKPNSPEHKAREKYLTYTQLTTLNSAINTLTLSLCAIFPTLLFPLSLINSIIIFTSTIWTFNYWFKSYKANRQLTKEERTADVIITSDSYLKILSTPRLSPLKDSSFTETSIIMPKKKIHDETPNTQELVDCQMSNHPQYSP